jgi:uroporphyrinogen-III synthase
MTCSRRCLRVLNTRPTEDAAELYKLLCELGYEVISEPLLNVRFKTSNPPAIGAFQAVLFTSRNGVRAFAYRSDERKTMAFAVGDATSREAESVGFEEVRCAAGNVKSLAALVVNQLNPRNGPLLHISASVTAGDLAGRLNKAGFGVEKTVLYETIPTMNLSTRTKKLFQNSEIDIVVLFSPRTARTFVALLKRAELLDFCKGLVVICLSKDVAAELHDITGISILTANEPTLEAVLRIFRDIDCGDWVNG